jgi:predicted small integral membrane protein
VGEWSTPRVVRAASAAFTLMVAVYYIVVAFDNITNPTNPNASNWPFVKGVVSGDGVPADSGFEWRFIDATWFQALGYVLVIFGEALTGVLLFVGGIKGLRNSRRPSQWASNQRWTFIGGIVGLAVFFLGFITIGGNWFIMYLNSKWNGLEPAFQNSVMTMFMLVFATGALVLNRLPEPSADESDEV